MLPGASHQHQITSERIMSRKGPQHSGPSAADAVKKSNPSCATGACPWTRRPWNWILWGALLAGVVAMQWPFLKGMAYRQVEAPASSIGWRTDFDAALAEAAETNRPLLVDFTADWCPPCQVMKHEVWPDPEVGRAIEQGYIPVLIDVDDAAQAGVVQRYAVEAIPTILIVDGRGGILRRATFLSRDGLLRFLAERDAG